MSDERKFKEVIHAIKHTEKDKDKFLKASKLERHEGKPRFEFDSCDLVAVLLFATTRVCHLPTKVYKKISLFCKVFLAFFIVP